MEAFLLVSRRFLEKLEKPLWTISMLKIWVADDPARYMFRLRPQ